MSPGIWLGGCAVAATTLAYGLCRWHNERGVSALVQQLGGAATQDPDPAGGASSEPLPPPVARYLARAVPNPCLRPASVVMHQEGELRTDSGSKRWLAFRARQHVAPAARGFLWDARVRLPLAGHVRVVDSYIDGRASGRVSLLSAWTMDSAVDLPALNAGALHRFLAESAWYPFALLPGPGLRWTAVGAQAAVATLSDHGTEVSLEFRFNDDDEIAAVYTPARYRRVGRGYRETAWEGHFSDYREQGGCRVPMVGEVGWHEEDGLQLAFRARMTQIDYRSARGAVAG